MTRARKRPHKAGADLCLQAGDRNSDNANRAGLQGDLVSYRALHLMQRYALPPQTAVAMAGLAFGCDQ